MTVFRAIWHITKNTFRESIRQPIYLLLLLSSLVLIGIAPFLSMFVFREEAKLVTDTAMATMLVFGWITAVLVATHAISLEIDTGTVLMVLSKPVNKTVFIFSKILGILLALTVFCYINSIASLMALRMLSSRQLHLDYPIMAIFFGTILLSCLVGGFRNYKANRSFTMVTVLSMVVISTLSLVPATILSVSETSPDMHWEIAPALLMVIFAVWAMGTLATALSTRLAVAGNLIVCFVIFMCGLMSDYMFGRFAEDSRLAEIVYAAVPNWQLFWLADALAADKKIPGEYLLLGGAYIVLLVGLFTLLAVLLFMDREVGRQRLS